MAGFSDNQGPISVVEAIDGRLSAVILSAYDPPMFGTAVVDLFRTAYAAIAATDSGLLLATTQAHYEIALQVLIPGAACEAIRFRMQESPFCEQRGITQRVGRILDLLLQHLGASLGLVMDDSDRLLAPLLCGFDDVIVDQFFARRHGWVPPTQRIKLSAESRERNLQGFLAACSAKGSPVTIQTIAYSARIDRRDLGRWRKGQLADGEPARRIEGVLSGDIPVRFKARRSGPLKSFP